MTFLELVQNRQSVREYLDKPVEREKIERCLEAARLAPSACNSQPWKFVVLDDPVIKEKVARETFNQTVSFNKFVVYSPVLIVIVSEPAKLTARIGGIIRRKLYFSYDIGIAAEHICLQAVEEGLGTCILGWFNESKIKKLLHIPALKRIELIITLGYPLHTGVRSKNRKEIKEIMNFNQYYDVKDYE